MALPEQVRSVLTPSLAFLVLAVMLIVTGTFGEVGVIVGWTLLLLAVIAGFIAR